MRLGSSVGAIAFALAPGCGAGDEFSAQQTGGAGGTAATAGQGGGSGGSGNASSASRVTQGLALLYELAEGSGTVVGDSSGVGAAYDLTIDDPGKVTWGAGFLDVKSDVRIANPAAVQKVLTRCQTSDEISLEAWVKPAGAAAGDARIISSSIDGYSRNFSLLQNADRWAARLRTTTSSNNGLPELVTPTGSATTALTHVVFARGATGGAAIYVDAVQKANGAFGGDFSKWDASFGVVVANEITDPRPWLGQLHLLAVYCRALSPAEVQQNFDAGP